MAADTGQEEHDRDAVARGRALAALVRPYLPVDVLVRGPADAWPLVGPALIARATGSPEAILAFVPLGREADADTLLRSLYEHVTTLLGWPASRARSECGAGRSRIARHDFTPTRIAARSASRSLTTTGARSSRKR